MDYIGDFAEDAAVNIYFTTNDGDGGAVAPSTAFEAADVVVYKDNSATQKTSDNGITMTSPFDTVTGLHLVVLDTSNDTGDAGFWVTGSDYTVVLSPDETVDSQTIVHVIGQFSIENRFMRGTDSAALASVATEGRLAELDAANLPSDVDDILADTNELQTDDIPTSIAALPTAAENADAVWDEDVVAAHNGADSAGSLIDDLGTPADFKADVSGVATSAALATVDGIVDNILIDTNELQGDWTNGGRLDLIIDAILADTNELQVDDVPGLIGALNDISVANIIAGVADGSYDLQEMMRLIFAACCLKSAGGGTNTITFRDSADGKDRITATVDANGNRTAVTLIES